MRKVDFKLRNLLARGPAWTDGEWQIILDAIRGKEEVSEVGEDKTHVMDCPARWNADRKCECAALYLARAEARVFKVGDKVQTRDGRAARIICDDRDGGGDGTLVALVRDHANGERTVNLLANGMVRGNGEEDQLDLVPARRTRTVWVTWWRDPGPGSSSLLPVAEVYNDRPRTPRADGAHACIRVELEEGRFDD